MILAKCLSEIYKTDIGVRRIELIVGWIIGPPAEREYAVDPVGVEIINPSP